ncbi:MULTISPECIES: cupin domain-containing protein [Vibrio]|uniref:Cupin domain-containing protein n=1 Tax=Vibrio qingdaonensis TaxID=2829491 RepID=A0A9X3HZG5_9VIBR|nr:cupin domain-containing protein [Vibrio qingdaonensis]MCW8349313.1 cupin domain-containing protein [Vibrio qingdaonensis]
MIRNFYTCDKEVDKNSHGGDGSIDIYRAFRRKDFDGAWDFAIRVVMPAGSSMGEHRHEDDEEMYIILKGEGTMIIEGEEHKISSGDMIVNKRFGTHGLVNTSDQEIELLIIQASQK